MRVGTLGNVVFEVSDTRVFTPSQVTRERKARIEEHQVQGALPCVEFIAPELGDLLHFHDPQRRPRRQSHAGSREPRGSCASAARSTGSSSGGLNWGKVIIESVTQDWRNSGPGGVHTIGLTLALKEYH